MRGRWLTIENKVSEQAIAGGACDPRIASMEFMLWLLLACITMSLSGCGGGPLRTYYYEDDRYDETKSGGVLLVSPGGQVVDATSVVSQNGYPSIGSEDGSLAGNEGRKPKPPAPELSPPAGEPAADLPKPDDERPSGTLVRTPAWKSDVADWDTSGYEIATGTGGCRPYMLSITVASFAEPNDPSLKKRSCWNLLWDIPASFLIDAAMGSLIIMKGYAGLLGGG